MLRRREESAWADGFALRWLSAAQRTVVAAAESWFKVFSTGQIRLHDLKISQSMTGGDKTRKRKKEGMQRNNLLI